MSEPNQPNNAEVAAELAAIDRLLAGRPDGSESPDLVGLTALLTVARPQPRPEFVAALDLKAEAGFGVCEPAGGREQAGERVPAGSREQARRRKPNWMFRWDWVRNVALVAAAAATCAEIIVVVSSRPQATALSSVATTISGEPPGTPSGSAQDGVSSSGADHTTSSGTSTSSGSYGKATTSGSSTTPSPGADSLQDAKKPSSNRAEANGSLVLKVAPNRAAATLADIIRTVKAHGGRVAKQQRTNNPLLYHLQVDVAADRLASLIAALQSTAGVKVLARQLPRKPAPGSRTVQLALVLMTA